MKSVDIANTVILDDTIRDNERLALIHSSKTVHCETSRQTSNTTEERFESLGEMMRDEVLVNLNHSPPSLLIVFQGGFTTNTGNLGVMGTCGNETVQGVFLDTSIGINHKKILVEFRIHTDDVVDLMEHLKLKRRHGSAVVDTVEEAHEENLRVTLSTVTRLSLGLFRFLANLDNDDIGDNVAFKLVKTGVNLAVVKLLTAGADGLEGEGRRINLGVNSENIENNLGRGTIVTLTNDNTITNDTDELALVIVLESRQRVQSLSKGVLTLSVDGNLANNKLVLRGRASLGAELKSSKELDGSDNTDDDSE
jgi:hypothetical protein